MVSQLVLIQSCAGSIPATPANPIKMHPSSASQLRQAVGHISGHMLPPACLSLLEHGCILIRLAFGREIEPKNGDVKIKRRLYFRRKPNRMFGLVLRRVFKFAVRANARKPIPATPATSSKIKSSSLSYTSTRRLRRTKAYASASRSLLLESDSIFLK